MSKLASKISKVVAFISAANLVTLPSISAVSDVENGSEVVVNNVDQPSSEAAPVVSAENSVNEAAVNVETKANESYTDKILNGASEAPVSAPDELEKYLDNQSWTDQAVGTASAVCAAVLAMNALREGKGMYDTYKSSGFKDAVSNHGLSLLGALAVGAVSGLFAYKSVSAAMSADALRESYSKFKSSPVLLDMDSFVVPAQVSSEDSQGAKVSDASGENPDASMAMKILM